MKILKFGLILLTAALFVLACNQTNTTNTNISNTTNTNSANNTVIAVNSTPPPTAPVDELAAARKTYSEVCIKCHKEDGLGGTTEIDGKKIKAPNFTSERMMKDDDAEWIEAIENGIEDDGMPAFKGRLTEQEIKNLVRMIRRDFQKK